MYELLYEPAFLPEFLEESWLVVFPLVFLLPQFLEDAFLLSVFCEEAFLDVVF